MSTRCGLREPPENHQRTDSDYFAFVFLFVRASLSAHARETDSEQGVRLDCGREDLA